MKTKKRRDEPRQIGVRLTDEERRFLVEYTGVGMMATAIKTMIRRAMKEPAHAQA